MGEYNIFLKCESLKREITLFGVAHWKEKDIYYIYNIYNAQDHDSTWNIFSCDTNELKAIKGD